MRVCNNSTPVPFLFHNSVHKVNQSVYKIKLFRKATYSIIPKNENQKTCEKIYVFILPAQGKVPGHAERQ